MSSTSYADQSSPSRVAEAAWSPEPAAGAAAESVLRRGLGAAGLLGIALIHVIDVPGKLSETPYLGVMYLLLIVSAVAVAEALLRRGHPVVWLATGLLAGSTLIGFVLSRTTGLPAASDDIGNWSEPLGVASLFVEGVVVLLAVTALFRSAAQRAAERS